MSIKGRNLVLSAIESKNVARIPWVPFCGVHSAKMIGRTATDFLKSTDLIVEGLSKAVELYRPDGIPVCFDLQLEAEILGCELSWSNENPPAVISHPLSQGTLKLEDLKIPGEKDGRMPIVLKATEILRKKYPDLALYGLITGPFTLALHLLGTDIFMGMYDNPEYIRKVLAFCAEVGKEISGMYIRNGCDIIAVVDPMTSQIGPEQFKEFCSEPAIEIFEHVRKLKAKSSFFVCGHAQNNIAVMCDCRCDNISIDENIPLDYVKEICLEKGVSFGGNMKLTTVMLLGKPEDNKINAIECMQIGGLKGFILAPGCDMPYATPENNVIAVAELVHDEYQRKIASELAGKHKAVEACLMDMSEYGMADKVIIDIITLDSEACAPCQYMVESVKSVIPEFGDLIMWREHKIKSHEAITMMSSLYVRNIPTICIDGQIKFVSRIPPREELIKAIQDRVKEKFSLKIQYNRGKILLLGNQKDEKFAKLKEHIQMALKELGSTVDFVEISDEKEIRKYGVFSTPAVIVEKFTVKSSGKTAEKNIIKEWIKSLND